MSFLSSRKARGKIQENYSLVSFTSISGKVMEKILLESISKDLKDETVIKSRQHGFMKGKSCLTNLVAFYSEVTSVVVKR